MNDFDFSRSLVENFSNQNKVQNALRLIEERGISGWEVWMQIEFATFLHVSHDNEIEWHRERQIFADRRINKDQVKMAADFVFRRKGTKRDSFIVLEYKQHSVTKSCISNMAKDVEKINGARCSSIEMRNFWVVGVHPKTGLSKAEIKKLVCDKFEFNSDEIYTKYIPGTSYAFTIF